MVLISITGWRFRPSRSLLPSRDLPRHHSRAESCPLAQEYRRRLLPLQACASLYPLSTLQSLHRTADEDAHVLAHRLLPRMLLCPLTALHTWAPRPHPNPIPPLTTIVMTTVRLHRPRLRLSLPPLHNPNPRVRKTLPLLLRLGRSHLPRHRRRRPPRRHHLRCPLRQTPRLPRPPRYPTWRLRRE